MAIPNSISGASASVKIDGLDMHTYGMTMNEVTNPVPEAVLSSIALPGKSGDFDFSNVYAPRIMTIAGNILGNTNADLLTNIDLLKNWLRLRANRGTMEVIFQNQTDRYWTCRYEGMFEIIPVGLWRFTKIATFTLILKCTKPYAEKTSLTTTTVQLSTVQNKEITYAGNVPTPLYLSLFAELRENLIEKDGGAMSEDNTLWTYSNATGSDNTTLPLFGTNKVLVTQVAGGAFYAEYDLFAELDPAKWYVIGAWVTGARAGATMLLRIVTTGGTDTSGSLFGDSQVTAAFSFAKMSPGHFTVPGAATTWIIRLYNDGTDATFNIDGVFVYEITEAQYADDDYYPAPYHSDPTGDDIVLPKNPGLLLFKNINIYPEKNGTAIAAANWGGDYANLSIVPDPLGGDEKCIMFSGAAGEAVSGPLMYVTGGKVYRLSFDYYVEHVTGAGLGLYLYLYDEKAAYIVDTIAGATPSVEGTAWTTAQAESTVETGCVIGRFYMLMTNEAVVYIKNIMVVETGALAEGYDTYVAPDKATCDYTGSLDDNDRVFLDMDKLIVSLHDFSANTGANAIANFSGDRLEMTPGTNMLRYQDARKGHASPEAESAGYVKAMISYRERYL